MDINECNDPDLAESHAQSMVFRLTKIACFRCAATFDCVTIHDGGKLIMLPALVRMACLQNREGEYTGVECGKCGKRARYQGHYLNTDFRG